MFNRRLPGYALVLAFWTTLGLMDIGQTYLRSPKPLPASFYESLMGAASAYAALAILTPIVFALLGRYPLGRPMALRSIAVLSVAGALFPVLHIVTGVAIIFVVKSPNVSFAGITMSWLGRWYAFDVFRYLALLGFYYALRNHEAAHERTLAAQRLKTRAARLQAQLAQARFATLNRQLQPHFLFNALNAISSLAYQGESARAIRMIASLSDLLRVSLEPTGPTTTLENELKFVKAYLDIEKIRFDDHLRVEIDVPPALLRAEVPQLVLQTLAENGVRHGVSLSVDPATLSIRARARDGLLLIEIADTGVGLRIPFRPGIGLRNTRARIRALYGQNARLAIRPGHDTGTVASLSLPLRFPNGLESACTSEVGRE
jgi:two-component system, LytTR family, sensor kinase